MLEGGGDAGQWGIKAKKWDDCNSIIIKYTLKKRCVASLNLLESKS